MVLNLSCCGRGTLVVPVVLTTHLFLQILVVQECRAAKSPRILDVSSELTLNAGDNRTLVCTADRPITWSTPELESPYLEWSSVNVTVDRWKMPKLGADANLNSDHLQYRAQLTLHNVSFAQTGFYRCHFNGSHEDRRSAGASLAASELYIYVRDEEHLAVNEVEVETVIVAQYSDAIFPCRPTSADVDVTLSLLTGEKLEGATYDPRIGFTLYVDHASFENTYMCVYSRDENVYESIVVLQVSFPLIESMAKPILEETSGGHTIVGQELVLECRIRTHAHINMHWETPRGPPKNHPNLMTVGQMQRSRADPEIISQLLTISNASLADKGAYTCTVSDNQNHSSSTTLSVRVFKANEHFIKLSEENDLYRLDVKAGMVSAQWRIDVEGHPVPRLTWLNQNGTRILNGHSAKYEVNCTDTEAILMIKSIGIEDYGNYTLLAENQYEQQRLVVFLNVSAAPTVRIVGNQDRFHSYGERSRLECHVSANPAPDAISWQFFGCPNAVVCNETLLLPVHSKHQNWTQLSSVEPIKLKKSATTHQSPIYMLTAVLRAVESGWIRCIAHNTLGRDVKAERFLVSDVKDGLQIFGIANTIVYDAHSHRAVIAQGESLRMTCGASVFNYTDDIQWLINDTLAASSMVERSSTKFSNRVTLVVDDIQPSSSGNYACRTIGRSIDRISSTVFTNISVVVQNGSAPIILASNMLRPLELNFPEPATLYCVFSGLPRPIINWFKNGELMHFDNRTHLSHDRQKISFRNTNIADEGVYECRGSNKFGKVTQSMELLFENSPKPLNRWLIIGLVSLLLVLVVILLMACIKLQKERRLQRELKIVGLANFEKGALENLNPELAIDDQADLLPYDRKWEFPIEKLKLGKQLGSGAFGVVLKAQAKGILADEAWTTVAVKMVKSNADHSYIRALASELKIMVHLGKHLNVVNLLGACTKNVVKRELMVIVEYCRYGNLHNFLLRHRDHFINQVDPETGRIDFSIGALALQRSHSQTSGRTSDSGGASESIQAPSTIITTNYDYQSSLNCPSLTTDTTSVAMNSDSMHGQDNDALIVSNNTTVQPEWRSNYRGDYKDSLKPISTKDLLTWAFQVARGMDYLSSRRVMHGDLAARNILLTENNVVKICDFGLAKSMYKNENYKKKSNVLLPVKWMAIESIQDRIFSTQSDIWSFGIVLWEFFSLARTPYPGMAADERLYIKLLDGYRMEPPEYCPRHVYKMMLDCWRAQPNTRPSFTVLSERLGTMLEDSVRKHYIDLNDPYLAMNTQRLENEEDYLSMVNPPTFQFLATGEPEDPAANARYLDMRRNMTDKSGKAADQSEEDATEMQPMLNAPYQANGFSNPYCQHHAIRTAEGNYVNMPQNKNELNNPFRKAAASKESNVSDATDGKYVHYVNSNSRDWESVKV